MRRRQARLGPEAGAALRRVWVAKLTRMAGYHRDLSPAAMARIAAVGAGAPFTAVVAGHTAAEAGVADGTYQVGADDRVTPLGEGL